MLPVACLACLAIDAAAALPTPFARSIDVRTAGGVDLSSFLDARPAAGDDGDSQALLGLRAGTALPEVHGRALIEYSVAVPDAERADDLAGPDQRLLRLRLDSHWRQLDYALRLFHVGEDYGRSAPARDHLNALGLPGAGRGAELSAAWTLLETKLQPRVRRVEQDEAAGRRLVDTHSLLLRRKLRGELDLVARHESTRRRLLGRDSDRLLDAQAGVRTRFDLRGASWNLFWTEHDHVHRIPGHALPNSRESTEVGLRLDAPRGVAVEPYYRLDRRRAEDRYTETASGRLGLTASLPVLRRVKMELEYRDRQELDAAARGVAAVLKMRRPLRLAEQLPQGVMLDAALSWRDSDAVGRPLWADGLGVQLSLEYRRAALR